MNQAPTGLTGLQLTVLEEIQSYYHLTGEGCSAAYIARQLGFRCPKTAREIFSALHSKGHLVTAGSPAVPLTFSLVR